MTANPTRYRPEDLMRSVAQLTQAELSEFVLRFDEWRLREIAATDARAAQIAESYRLPADVRVRVAELLTKNREVGLTDEEEAELDSYLRDMDQRLLEVADKLVKISERDTPSRRPARS